MNTAFDLQEARSWTHGRATGSRCGCSGTSRRLVCVHVCDSRTREEFVVVVDRPEAVSAFHHPFAYARLGRFGVPRCSDNRSRKEVGTEPVPFRHTPGNSARRRGHGDPRRRQDTGVSPLGAFGDLCSTPSSLSCGALLPFLGAVAGSAGQLEVPDTGPLEVD